jgi:single-strand DNA-binding protein
MEETMIFSQLNTVIIEGNLTRDPELKATPKGTPVCNFSLASNRYYMVDEESKKDVYFFDVEAWSALAENCGKNLTKGKGIKVVGKLRQDRWTDGEGKNHSRIKIVADHIDFKLHFSKDGKDVKESEAEKDEAVEKVAV